MEKMGVGMWLLAKKTWRSCLFVFVFVFVSFVKNTFKRYEEYKVYTKV